MGKYTGLFFGLTTVDMIYTVCRHVGNNEKLKAQSLRCYAGGPAANAAVAFSALNGESGLHTSLGEHPVAQLARDDLAEHGVELFDYVSDSSRLPVVSSIMVNAQSGDRAVVYTHNQQLLQNDFRSKEIDFSTVDVVLCDGHYLEDAVTFALMAKEADVVVVLDGGSWKPGFEKLLELADYAICSDDFFPPGCQSQDEVFSFLGRYSLAGCAISKGEKPIIFQQGLEQESIEVPAVEAVDTLGAGDILHGAFCYQIINHSFAQSLQNAAQIASQACRYPGTRAWIAHQ